MQPARLDKQMIAGMHSKFTTKAAKASSVITVSKPRSYHTESVVQEMASWEINLDFDFGRVAYHYEASIICDKAAACTGARRRGDGDGCSDKILGLIQSDVSGSER